MSQITLDDFEKVYADPVPVNGHLLVEVVDKDPTRKTKGGILIQEEQIGNASPYFVVVKVAGEGKVGEETVEVGDIVLFTERNIFFFYGKDMQKLAVLPLDKVVALYKKDPKKKVPYKKEEKKSKIITSSKDIIVDD